MPSIPENMDSNPWQSEHETSTSAIRPQPPYPIDPSEMAMLPPEQTTQSHENPPHNMYEASKDTVSQGLAGNEARDSSHAAYLPLAQSLPKDQGYETIPYTLHEQAPSEQLNFNSFSEDPLLSSAPNNPASSINTQSIEISPPSNAFALDESKHQAVLNDIVYPHTTEPTGVTNMPSNSLVPPQSNTLAPPLPPRRPSYGGEDLDSPIHYTRDPHKLIAYLIPFPKPRIKDADSSKIEDRFLIYTPPPPPLAVPKEGEKEAKFHKVQRKWEQEVRQAKTSEAKVTSWKGIKSKATKGIDWAMGSVKSSNLDFLNRVPATSKAEVHTNQDEAHAEGDTTKKTVGLEEMVLVYPADAPGTEEEIRAEFVNSMLRTKSKAQRDAVIASGLFPVALAIDILAGPFGGLAEIDGVWAFASIRGAKTARSVTKRLTSTNPPASAADGEQLKNEGQKLKLTFTPSQRLEVLKRYLAGECHKQDSRLFPNYVTKPVETDVIAAIGWSPSHTAGETRNWEDEQWELTEVKEDFKQVIHKGAKEWDKWCKGFEKDPEKAPKK